MLDLFVKLIHSYWLVLLCLAFVIVLYVWYAGIITKKNKVMEALSGVDVQQKKRSNLIPNILKISQKFMDHEKALLTTITELRSKVDSSYQKSSATDVKEHLTTIETLGSNMSQLMIAVENYPDLKSDQNMLQAQQTYNEVEASIAAARRFYNASVTDLNNSIQIFPGNLLAKLANAESMPFYEAEQIAKKSLDANEYLS